MKRLSDISILACMIAGAMLVHTASPSGKALAGNGEYVQTQSTEADPADNKGDRLPMPQEMGARAKNADEATKAAANKAKPKAAAPVTETVDAKETSGADVAVNKPSGPQTDDLLGQGPAEFRLPKAEVASKPAEPPAAAEPVAAPRATANAGE